MILKNYIILKSTNKTIRGMDAIQEEMNYIIMKFSRKYDLIDIRGRVNILRLLKTVVAMKCYYGLNLYEERDSLINLNKATVECLRYSIIEI